MKPTHEDVNAYLIALRESGEANMFFAAPYLEEAFNLSKAEARAALFAWMEQVTKGEKK